MNFLAHALLAGDHSALVIGGVVGDWIKGPPPGSLPSDLSKGVALHRAIESFAETHPAFWASRERISQVRRRYGGVLVDIVSDRAGHTVVRHIVADTIGTKSSNDFTVTHEFDRRSEGTPHSATVQAATEAFSHVRHGGIHRGN